MEGLEIGKIVAEFLMTALVLYLCSEQIKQLKEQLKERDERIDGLQAKLEKCNEAHQRDLKGWAGIERWTQPSIEDDTRRYITEEKRKRLAEEWEKRNNTGSSA
jgi:predicted RNase H-like nuclease (RuvC/YqgF family)